MARVGDPAWLISDRPKLLQDMGMPPSLMSMPRRAHRGGERVSVMVRLPAATATRLNEGAARRDGSRSETTALLVPAGLDQEWGE